MRRDSTPSSMQRAGSLASGILLVAALYVGKALFVPFALAMLGAFLLAPIVHRLERMHLARAPAVVVTVFLVTVGVAGLGWMVYAQLDELGDRLPEYRSNIRQKVEAFRGGGAVAKIQEGLSDVVPPDARSGADSGKPPAATPTSGAPRTDVERARMPGGSPLPVTLVAARPTPVQFLGDLLGPFLAPLATLGVVFVLVLFMLVYQEDLRNRLIRLVSRSQIVRTTQALSDVSHRISRYLLMTLVVNATYGIPIGIGLWALGVPNALLWGVFAVLLRFIPYVGPWIAASFPILLSFAIAPDWSLTAWVVGLFVVLELISNNLVEPLVAHDYEILKLQSLPGTKSVLIVAQKP